MRVGLMAMTGGQSVVIADTFAREGLQVPLLTSASYEKLSSFFNIIGGSYRNPLDIGGTIGWAWGSTCQRRTMKPEPASRATASMFSSSSRMLSMRSRLAMDPPQPMVLPMSSGLR